MCVYTWDRNKESKCTHLAVKVQLPFVFHTSTIGTGRLYMYMYMYMKYIAR